MLQLVVVLSVAGRVLFVDGGDDYGCFFFAFAFVGVPVCVC